MQIDWIAVIYAVTRLPAYFYQITSLLLVYISPFPMSRVLGSGLKNYFLMTFFLI
jgi:hypothetical protein